MSCGLFVKPIGNIAADFLDVNTLTGYILIFTP